MSEASTAALGGTASRGKAHASHDGGRRTHGQHGIAPQLSTPAASQPARQATQMATDRNDEILTAVNNALNGCVGGTP